MGEKSRPLFYFQHKNVIINSVAKSKKKYTVIGIDEVGRGPLAGPISVAAIVATTDSQLKLLKNIKDSKKLSEKQREEWFVFLKKNFDYKVAMVGPHVIDRIGIQRATRLAIARVLRRMNKPDIVLLDGLLKAPKYYNQETIIKGDEKVPLISAASIVAKVYRDRKMKRFHQRYPEYNLNIHKGYGTKMHYKKIKKYGISELHRKTYLKNAK